MEMILAGVGVSRQFPTSNEARKISSRFGIWCRLTTSMTDSGSRVRVEIVIRQLLMVEKF